MIGERVAAAEQLVRVVEEGCSGTAAFAVAVAFAALDRHIQVVQVLEAQVIEALVPSFAAHEGVEEELD